MKVNKEIKRPALRYFGGKWRIAPWIIDKFPLHYCYVEPFGGAASVLLRKKPSKIEVYNDTAGAVVNFFQVLREKPNELIQLLELTPFALLEYKICKRQEGNEVERARRFFVRSWGGYNGVNGIGSSRGWRRSKDRNTAQQFHTAVKSLYQVAERLSTVLIDSIDYKEILKRYDNDNTLFYIDPPYLLATRKEQNINSGYGKEFELVEEEHLQLCKLINEVKGKVVISGYDSKMYDDLLKGWTKYEHFSKTQKGSSIEVLWVKSG